MIKWLERLIYGELPPAHKVAEQEAKEAMRKIEEEQERLLQFSRDLANAPPRRSAHFTGRFPTSNTVVRTSRSSRSNDRRDSDSGIDMGIIADAASYTPSSSYSSYSSSSSSSSSSDSCSSSSSDSGSSSSSSGCD